MINQGKEEEPRHIGPTTVQPTRLALPAGFESRNNSSFQNSSQVSNNSVISNLSLHNATQPPTIDDQNDSSSQHNLLGNISNIQQGNSNITEDMLTSNITVPQASSYGGYPITPVHDPSSFQLVKNRKRATVNLSSEPASGFKEILRLGKKQKVTASTLISKQFVETANRFTILQSNNDEMEESTGTETQHGTPKPKPIFVLSEKWNELMQILHNDAKDQYTYKLDSNNLIKILPKCTKTYSVIVQALEQHNISFHTFQLTGNRCFRVVLRGMHHSVSLDDLKVSIESLNHKVIRIHNIRHRESKLPLNMFFVELEQRQNNNQIFDIQYLLHAKISFEAPHPRKDVVQCYRCQRYGHTKTYCRHPFRCVKCGQNHSSNECTKPDKSTPALCTLCGGAHPANYRGCIVYSEIKKRKYPSHPSHSTASPVVPTPSSPQPVLTRDPRLLTPGRTYASVVNNPTASVSSATRKVPPPNARLHTEPLQHNDMHANDNTQHISRLEQIILQQADFQARLSDDIRMLINLLTTLVSKLG